ncbi:hypothetical protein BGZ74_008195 [Mortierella antarctica]|nr:hypothetical protein BGZ74_008195 [Mortierella antarctica]
MGPSIGHMPEILDIILEYLDQSTVRYSASCVNKMWNAACRPYIHTVTKWNVFQTEETLLAHHKSVQKQASILHVFQPDDLDTIVNAPYHGGKPHDNIKLLVATLKGLSLREQQQYTALIIHDTYSREWNVHALLPFLPHLRHLRIEKWEYLVVALDTILHACPLLTHLNIAAVPTVCDYGTSSIRISQRSIPPPDNIQLQSLTFEEMILSVDPLLSILSSCKLLTELKLISMQQPRFGHHQPYCEYRRIKLFTRLRAVCPGLQSLHFSLKNSVMSRLTLRDIEDLFPDLNAWSCSKADANRPMFAFLKNTYHHLTTLEITSEYQLAAIPLHEYLGEAPNLVHLRAPEVFINIEDLQVHLTAQQTTRGALWACSRLETLHISIQDGFDKNSTRQHSFSRALFTYLATVCPKLVDVYISYSTLTFEMESGFCQLSKLKNLRSLQLKTARPQRVTELDLWWTSASSLSRRKLWSSPMEKLKVEATLAKMRMSKEAKAPIPFVFGGFSSEEEVLEKGLCFDQSHIDIDNVVQECHLSSTVDLLDSMLMAKENGSDVQCWPDLEIWSLIKSGQFPAPVQVDLIEKLRPGIRFKRSIYCDLAE